MQFLIITKQVSPPPPEMLVPMLDAIMARFPFAPFSAIEVIALSDLDKSLANAKAFVQEMMAGMAKA